MLTIVLASSTSGDGLSSLPPKLAEGTSTAASTTTSTTATSGGLFGGGIFGKPATSSTTTPLVVNKDAAPLGMIVFFKILFQVFSCATSKATSGGLFGNSGNKQPDKKNAAQTGNHL